LKKYSRAIITVALLTTTASAADMPRYANALSSDADVLASDMARYRGIAVACRVSDGTNLNRAWWEPRIAALVPLSQRGIFTETVKRRSAPIIQSMSGPDSPLKCDDALDVVEDQFPSIAEAGPAAEPICWSSVDDTNRCEGTGEDDILAGVPALLDGY
jgi:hypothetical protein